MHGRPGLPHVRRRRAVPDSQVTLNLPAAQLSSKITIYTTLVNPFSKYALMVTPTAPAIEERIVARARGPRQPRGRRGRGEDAAGAEHGGGGRRGAVLRVPHDARGLGALRRRVHGAAVRLLPQDLPAGVDGLGRGDRRDPGDVLFVAVTGTYSSVMQIVRER